MGLVAPPQYSFGGIDSRSNPVNRPNGRAIKCENWVPTKAGFLQLRNGYSEVTMSPVTASAIHSLFDYKKWDGTRYVLFVQGVTLKRMDMSTGTVTTLGTLSSSADCDFERSDNKIFIVNGADQKWYDGTTLRDIGITAATAAQVSACTITEALRDYTASEGTTSTVTADAAAGAFAATTKTGYLIYGHYVNATSANGYGHGAGRVLGAGTRTTFAAGATNRFQLASLPTGYTGNLKIYSRTDDGTSISHFCATASKAVTNLAYVTATRVVTITAVGHGYSAGDVVETAVSGWEGVFVIGTTPTADTFTYTDLVHNGSGTTGVVTGTAYRLLSTALATATQDILLTMTGEMQANGEVGLAPSTVGGSQPGYLIAASMYNPTAGHAGNYKTITGRIYGVTNRSVWLIQGLPSLAGTDTEFRWVFGRTGDGANVPYPIVDSALNKQYIDNTHTSFVLRESSIDGSIEMPATNDKPSGLIRVTKVGARLFGAKDDSPYIYNTPAGNIFGKREQSWDEDAFSTFPTGDATVAQAEYDQELIVFTESDVAILTDLSGVLDWRGPWNLGIAGPRAWTKTPYGFYWVTGDKRLAKVSPEGPVPVSDEYESGTLSEIGDDYLADVEIAYLNDQARGIDRLVINCKDSSGIPFQVYHDFNLDGQEDGQGYTGVFEEALASAFTMRQVRDSNRKMRIWCGGADGQIYELETGPDDNGTDFTAEYIALVNLGEMRVSNPWAEFYGDEQINVYHGKDLNTTYTQIQDEQYRLGQSSVQGGDNNFKNRVTRKSDGVENPQYFRFVLTSHPSDAPDPTDPMVLSDPPQMPVEDYGRLYGAKVALADSMGA